MEQTKHLKELRGLSLPKLEEDGPRPRRRGAHYLMETPEGEVLSVSDEELSAYLQRYGTARRDEDTGNS